MGGKVYFIGAGPGDPDLLTVKGRRIIEESDVIVYADSLVDPRICDLAPTAEVHGSASLNLEQIADILVLAASQGKTVARIHSGDPAVYGAVREQMDILDQHGVEHEIVPGVSSVFAAAAQLEAELTVPGVSQTVILTRREGRTPVPENENLASLAAHQATMAIYLSAGQIEGVVSDLLTGGYPPETPAAIVFRATWPDERIIRGTIETVAAEGREAGIEKQALILVGGAIDPGDRAQSSKLYNKTFPHGFRGRSNLPRSPLARGGGY